MREKEVVVLDQERRFLRYIHPAVARRLLTEGQAVVHTREPFTIQLIEAKELNWD